MTEIAAQSAGTANMLLSKWSVVAFSISEKAPPHSQTSRKLYIISRVTFVDHKNGCSFISAALSCLTEHNGGFEVYNPAVNQPFSVKPVWTQEVSAKHVAIFFKTVLNYSMIVCFSSFF